MVELTPDHGNAVRSLNQLLNWYLNESDEIGQDQPWLVSDIAPTQIREFVSLLRATPDQKPASVSLHLESITESPWYAEDNWFKESIDEIIDLVQSDDAHWLLDTVILHGSMGSGDYSLGWSDFDIFAVVSDAAIDDPKLMLQLRDKSRQISDALKRRVPLQHHGVQFVTTDSLAHLDEASLPVAALKRGKILGSSIGQILVNPVFDPQSSLQLLNSRIRLFRESISSGEMHHHAYNGVYLQDSYRNASNGMYQLKYLLDVCTLAPAIAVAASGTPTDKGSAIAKLSTIISATDWTVVDAATEVRQQWAIREGTTYEGNQIPEWIQEFVGPTYFEQALNLYVRCAEFAVEIASENANGNADE